MDASRPAPQPAKPSARKPGLKKKKRARSSGARLARQKQQRQELRALAQRQADEAPPPGSTDVAARQFAQLALSKPTQEGLRKGGFMRMTEIQRASIPHALAGRDVQACARTGSGKTLSFLVPLLERLYASQWTEFDGLGGLIISPTRELALQIFDVLRLVGSRHSYSAGLVIGGKDVAEEKGRIVGMNILVCTPGRLLQHMDETVGFSCENLLMLVLDEADRILDLGFSEALRAIMKNLPAEHQTLLFSATLARSVATLARNSLNKAETIGVVGAAIDAAACEEGGGASGDAYIKPPSKLKHAYLECELPQKVDMLYSFVRSHTKCRMLVFVSSCKQTRFVYEVLRRARPGLPVSCLHGRMKQMARLAAYSAFCEDRAAIMVATDIAARGLDFPKVDWVIHLDCPEDVATYIHRAGRSARFRRSGKSLLVLMPSERAMLEKLRTQAKVEPQLLAVDPDKVQTLRSRLGGWVAEDADLKFLAQKAFVTFARSYHLQADKAVFDVHALPWGDYALSLGLPSAPKIRFVKKKSPGAAAAASAAAKDAAGDELVPPSTTAGRSNVERLMARQNASLVQRHRLLETADSSDDEGAVFELKREDHEIEANAMDADAEMKMMSRKQRQETKRRLAGRETKAPTRQQAALLDPQAEADRYAGRLRQDMLTRDVDDKVRDRERIREQRRVKKQRRAPDQDEQGGGFEAPTLASDDEGADDGEGSEGGEGGGAGGLGTLEQQAIQMLEERAGS